MIKTILTIIVVILLAMVIFAIIKKLIKIALTLFVIAIIVVGGTAYLVKIDYNELSENFNEMDTLIVVEQDGEYVSALEGLEPVENASAVSLDHELVVIINEEMDLESEFDGTSKENVKKIVMLKAKGKAEVKPETMLFKMAGWVPLK